MISKNNFNSQKLKFSIGIIISMSCLYWVFKDVSFRQIIISFKLVNLQYLPLILISILLTLFCKNLRWQLLLSPIKREKAKNIFSVMMIGYLGNNILPARMGEVLRAMVLKKNYGYSKSASFATILLERLLDGITLLIYLAVTIWFFTFPQWVKNGGWILGLTFLIVILLLYFLIIKKKMVNKLMSMLFVVDPLAIKIQTLFEKFQLGLKILRKKRELFKVSVLSLLVWLIEAVGIFIFIKSFGLTLSFIAPLFVTIVVNLGMMIPSSPGYIGTYQFMCIAAFTPFGVQKEMALSMSILMQGMVLFITTGLGLYCLWRENMHWVDVQQKVDLGEVDAKLIGGSSTGEI